ncbi:MAG: SseB family protein [Methanobrevibacter sp.]|uniref:SseB family protein n=1 Tax=Methanobrevibacter sp. TaxID=66852 RepID=UPI0025E4A618|nr:SseB family protein [Methanobrevibacter sp.]MBE6507916.1 SseB family protein [Methanobrevibacter sp.]
MTRTITHKHLKRQFDIFERTEDIDDLIGELLFSTLLLPVYMDGKALTFPILSFNDKNYAPVFTDVHEYNKCNADEGFTLMPNEFDFYMDLIDSKIDGIIIDVEGERFPITKEIKEFIKPNRSSCNDSKALTKGEIRAMKNSFDNAELEEFLKDESNFWDYERLMELLLEADLLKVVLSMEDLSAKAEDGIICLQDIGQLPSATTTSFTESFALIYTSQSEIKPKNSPMHPYSQLVNLPELMNKVLLDDLDGIVLNENSQNISIPREFLLNFMKDCKFHNPDRYDGYAFVLGD